MKVKIKSFDVEMEVKNKGIEFDVFKPDGVTRLGDCIVTKKGIIWCKGKTSRANGIQISWDDFINWMENEEE